MISPDLEEKLFYHWIKNLVGSNGSFVVNIILTLGFGITYSFGIFPSYYMLLVFGVVSPVLFTICLYSMLLHSNAISKIESFPKAFISRAGNRLLMLFDISLIIGFALLIYSGILNNLFFRFLQTVLFPVLLLIFLRVIFLTESSNNFTDDFFRDTQ